MASFADMLIQSTSEQNQKVGSGLAGALTQGIGLAQEAEKIQMQRQAHDQQKAQLQQAKLAKFAEAVEKGQAYAGKAQKNYYDKFLPAFRDSLGLTEQFSDDTLAFMSASPENLGRIRTLIADVRAGHITEQQAIAQINDPIAMADVPITSDTYKILGEAAKTAIENRQELKKQQTQLQATATEKLKERQATGTVKRDQEFAKTYEDYQAAGGFANVQKNIGQLEEALADLKKQAPEARSGGKSGLLGDTATEIFNPEAASVRDKIRGAIQGSLKVILGGQFTEREAEAIFNRAYNPRLSNAENARRVEAELAGIRNKASQMERSSKFFEQRGTLEGFTPSTERSAKTYTLGGRSFTETHLNEIKKKNPKLAPEINKLLGGG